MDDDVLLLLREREEFIAILTRGFYWNLSSLNPSRSHIMLNILYIILKIHQDIPAWSTAILILVFILGFP